MRPPLSISLDFIHHSIVIVISQNIYQLFFVCKDNIQKTNKNDIVYQQDLTLYYIFCKLILHLTRVFSFIAIIYKKIFKQKSF